MSERKFKRKKKKHLYSTRKSRRTAFESMYFHRDENQAESLKIFSKGNLRKTRKNPHWSSIVILGTITAVLAGFYAITLVLYPDNNTLQLVGFALLYFFLLSSLIAFVFLSFSGGEFSLKTFFFESFYKLIAVVAGFSLFYLPLIVLLAALEANLDFVKIAFVLVIIIFPIGNVLSMIRKEAKERAISMKDYVKYLFSKKAKEQERTEEEQKKKTYDEFYQKIGQVKDNYENNKRFMSGEDFANEKTQL